MTMETGAKESDLRKGRNEAGRYYYKPKAVWKRRHRGVTALRDGRRWVCLGTSARGTWRRLLNDNRVRLCIVFRRRY